MSADSSDQAKPATQRPWRLQRIRTPTPSPSLQRTRIRVALTVAAALCVLTIAGALGAGAIGGKRAGARSAIGASEENSRPAQVAPNTSAARLEKAAPLRAAEPAPVSSSSQMPATRAPAPVLEPGRDYPGLGVRARPLSEAERREMGAGAPDNGWKIINAREGAPLRRGDVITGACGNGAASSLRDVMASLTEETKLTQCLVVLRNGETIRIDPDRTGPSP